MNAVMSHPLHVLSPLESRETTPVTVVVVLLILGENKFKKGHKINQEI